MRIPSTDFTDLTLVSDDTYDHDYPDDLHDPHDSDDHDDHDDPDDPCDPGDED